MRLHTRRRRRRRQSGASVGLVSSPSNNPRAARVSKSYTKSPSTSRWVARAVLVLLLLHLLLLLSLSPSLYLPLPWGLTCSSHCVSSRALAHPLTRTPKNSLGFFFQSQNLFTELESLCPDLPAIPWICLLQQFPKSKLCAPQSQSSQSGTKPRDSLNIRSRTLTRPLGFLHQNHHIAKLTSISVSSPTERAAREKATCSLERHFKSKPANGCVDPTRLHALRLDHPRTLASHTGGEASVFPTRSTHLNLQSFVEQQQQTR